MLLEGEINTRAIHSYYRWTYRSEAPWYEDPKSDLEGLSLLGFCVPKCPTYIGTSPDTVSYLDFGLLTTNL